jgi:chloramphenicol-sensitive protein RarD|tara:strand:+ start:87402 stop:88283 length:882 start_codon:yes stop_codon:yes gene_type:complete
MKPHTYGVLCGLAAFTLWGILPAFWRNYEDIPPLAITAHRVMWSTFTLLIILAVRGRLHILLEKIKQPRILVYSFLTSLPLITNWLIYIWAVNNDQVVSISLGYFILPLMYIVIGYFMLNESMSRLQMIAVGIATIAVVVQGIGIGGLPWPALSVATAFAIYGVVKKKTQADGFSILTIELGLLTPFAIAYIYQQSQVHDKIWLDGSPSSILLIMLSGAATITPLLFFTAAAKRIPLNLIGMLQFIAPTGQFLIGLLYFQEVINLTQVFAFTLIWIAIIIYSISSFKISKTNS